MLKLDSKLKLTKETILAPNLTGYFTERECRAIAEHVWEGYKQDKFSRNKWEKRTDAAMNLAMQVVEGKTFPWAGCANVTFPLVTIAALQFHSKAYPAILPSSHVVQYRVNGADPDGSQRQRAIRIGDHMSWQLLEEDSSWEEQHDRLLISVPIVGCAFKKTYRSGAKNISTLVLAHDLVLDYYAKSVEDCARKTHVIPVYRNEIYTNVKEGIYRNILEETWYKSNAVTLPDVHQAKENKRTGEDTPQSTEDTPFTLLEQHCFLDLDGDGYREPYIATIELGSHSLIRLTSRIDRMDDITKTVHGEIIHIQPTEYFTKYGFIPSPDGSVYDIGFGVLLGPLNETTNSLINQLLDAGTMATTAGGFLGRGAKVRGGAYTFAPLEWKRVDSTGDDLRKNIFPLPVREPSAVLFQLLSLIINYTGRISGTTDTNVGENPGQNTPATTMQTMVEQGSKVYSAIFKRICRAMKGEFKKLYILNAIHMPDTQIYGSKGMTASRDDYLGDPGLVAPVADPNITSEGQRIQQAMALAQRAAQVPGYNPTAIERRLLQALRVEGVEEIYIGADKVQPGVDPKVQIEQMKMQVQMAKLEFEKMSFVIEMQDQARLTQAKIMELEAKAALEMEQAGGVKTGHDIAMFDAAIGAMRAHHDVLHKRIELAMKGIENERSKQAVGGDVQGLASAPNDQGAAQATGAMAAGT